MCLVVGDCHVAYVFALHGVVPRLAVCLHPAASEDERSTAWFPEVWMTLTGGDGLR